MEEEKKVIKVTELDMDFLVLDSLLNEEIEVFTDYGKGICKAYLNSDIKKHIQVIPVELYKEKEEEIRVLKQRINKLNKNIKSKRKWF